MSNDCQKKSHKAYVLLRSSPAETLLRMTLVYKKMTRELAEIINLFPLTNYVASQQCSFIRGGRIYAYFCLCWESAAQSDPCTEARLLPRAPGLIIITIKNWRPSSQSPDRCYSL